MSRLKVFSGSILLVAVVLLGFVSVSAHDDPNVRHSGSWIRMGFGKTPLPFHFGPPLPALLRPFHLRDLFDLLEGQRLFERETFGGNGRTCLTCHTRETGTVSPQDAQKRFRKDPGDALFDHDGSDDGLGHGVTRMLRDATVLINIPLASNVEIKGSTDRFVTLRRGIPTTLNTPALDPVLMVDGRQPDLEAQALGAIRDHAQSPLVIRRKDLERIADFQQTVLFSSLGLALFDRGGPAPGLPQGRTASEKRGRIFFEDVPPDVANGNFKPGACAACHSGPLLNQTNQFLPVPVPPGTRFQTVLVSELNALGNPPITFVFHNQAHGDANGDIQVTSPDPGRALITGIADDGVDGTFDSLNAFKISPLRGIKNTAPYFHDNSAKTLEAVVAHYATFFAIVSDPDGPGGPAPPLIVLTPQDQADIVAFMKLL
jgi:cytochrome c peroxidase